MSGPCRIVALALPLAAAAGGCARDPLDWECPALAAGDLVVSEIRGPQSTDGDSYGEWIELYNHTDQAVDLRGAALTLKHLDGSGPARILVRAATMTVAARGYVVLGRFPAGQEPAHVDYGYQVDFDTGMYDSAVLVVESCGVPIDQVVYHSLPGAGTLGVDGADEPDGEANDDEEMDWCVDDAPGDDPTQLGLPGTPGERNRPCA